MKRAHSHTTVRSHSFTVGLALILIWFGLPVFSVEAAISLVNEAPSAAGLNDDHIDLSVPAGTADGDVMIAQVSVNNGTGTTITEPAGWTLIRRDNRGTALGMASYYRVATAGEPAAYTWNFNRNRRTSGGILTYRGVDNTAPINASGGQDNGSSTSITAPSITTSVIETRLVGFFSIARGTSIAPPGGMTERWEVSSGAGGGLDSESADEVRAAAGATGTRVATASNSDVNIGQLIALKPATVSGSIYRDTDINGTLTPGEDWSAGVSVFVNLVQSGAVVQTVTVNPGTGAYTFIGVAAGTYTIVVTNGAANTTAVAPAGWFFVSPTSGSLSLTTTSVPVSNHNFGLLNGSRLSGRVFADTGIGGGIANDGIQNGSEAGLAGASIRLTDSAGGTVYSTAISDGSGNYALIIPGSLSTGTSLRVTQTNLAGYLSTGGSAGTTGGTYTRDAAPIDTLSFTLTAGTSYSGVHFTDVPVNSLTTDGLQAALPGTEVFYPHTFIAATGGTVLFSMASTAIPAMGGWSEILYRDSNCSGGLDPGEPQIASAIGTVAGDQICILVKNMVPANAPNNAQSKVTVTAMFTYAGAAPALVAEYARVNLTTVGTATNAGLKLSKAVNTTSAVPGATLIYTVTYTNNSSQVLSSVIINDSTPVYTTFVGAACGPLGSGLSGCSVTTQPVIGGTGAVQWTLSGMLNPSAVGSVTLTVQVEP